MALALGAGAALAAQPVRYTVALADPEQHWLRVTVELPPGAAQRQVQLPTWNALYQVRDFSQNVDWIRAQNAAQHALPLRLLDKSTWEISGAGGGAEVQYEIFADLAGPFGAQFNRSHAFLNLAQVLVYSPDLRGAPVSIRFTGIPSDWKIATALSPDPAQPASFSAADYDHLVDAPVEMGKFREASFTEAGAEYRIVVDAPQASYDLTAVEDALRKITVAEVTWMADQPFDRYLFIYHFPQEGGGGMEHAYSCAIDLPAARMASDPLALEKVSAHEFFHLWNVKRIRPASLAPVDYTRENYSRALWFSEGLTSTVQEIALRRAGLMDERQYLADLALAINTLGLRPARQTQSLEESSLDAWLEKYPDYRRPQRSISYYNKGQLVGVLLDLALRQATNDHKSLRDLFQWMNAHYARQNRFFPDSEGVRQAAEAVSGADFGDFFHDYVAGVAELPFDRFLAAVGLELREQPIPVAVLGFESARNFAQAPVVVAVDANSDAARAGIHPDDIVLALNGALPAGDLASAIHDMKPGDSVRLKLQTASGRRQVKIKLGARMEQRVSIVEVPHPTAQQLAWRAAWLKGEDQP